MAKADGKKAKKGTKPKGEKKARKPVPRAGSMCWRSSPIIPL